MLFLFVKKNGNTFAWKAPKKIKETYGLYLGGKKNLMGIPDCSFFFFPCNGYTRLMAQQFVPGKKLKELSAGPSSQIN